MLILFSSTLLLPRLTQAEALVAVSIKPVHSLVSSLMRGVGQPELIVSASGSPHGYNMRPSEMRTLQNAALIVWIGPELETFLDRPLKSRARRDSVLTLLTDVDRLKILPAREGGAWEEPEKNEHSHAHAQKDPHIWLSPDNARTIADAVLARLLNLDPKNSRIYRANHAALIARIDALAKRLTTLLESLSNRNYIVFHDAYQYFEESFRLTPIGALAVDPDRRPGARRLAQLRNRIINSSVSCIFTEPQFEPRLVETLTEGTPVRVGVLDPLGADLEPGPELYFQLMVRMADSLVNCLSPAKDNK